MDQIPYSGIELSSAYGSYLQTEIAQRTPQVAFDVEKLALKELAAGQQHTLLLTGERLNVHRLEQPNSHHLRDSAGVVAVTFVDLLGL